MAKECCSQTSTSTRLEPAPSKDGITKASTSLTTCDIFGAWKARWGIGRTNYTVEPGLYSIGSPDGESPVLVSANYKLTFDVLRKNLTELDCWLLILDTKGVNVWCAAGEGTFGTDELVNRIESVRLSDVISHRKLILPQLGAPGINAHEIAQRTGFSVTYGPVRAEDIQGYITAGCNATKEMRRVNFNFIDRLKLIPMELVPAMKMTLPIMGALLITNQFAKRPFGKADIAAYAGAILTGSVITPMLLPYIPGKAFSWKGWIAGLLGTVGILGKSKGFKKGNRLMSAGQLLLFPALSSYLALNFTGSTTYTSPSGVKKEMEIAMPLIIAAGIAGGIIMLGSYLFGRRSK
ncbi:MAG: mercury methylation corrinoid protein HgcA [Defluviitaleaceae bacterium]|nr:mercury methylation corrinoid protein HgcA [Defluviitaleaceae bacterium]